MKNQEDIHLAELAWQPYEGVMVAYGVQPKTVVAYLRQLNVVSEVDWFGATPYLMGINVLANQEGMVACLKDETCEYEPCISLSELVNNLAETFSADVRIGGFNANQLPQSETVEHTQVDPDRLVRVLEITDLSLESVPFCAMFQNLNLAALSLEGKKTVICYEVPESDFYPEMFVSNMPLVKLWVDSKDEKILALAYADSGEADSRSHSWKMQTEIAAGAVAQPSSDLNRRIRLDLGHGEAPSFIAKIAGCDEQKLADSFEKNGSEGFTQAAQALGIPQDMLAFLRGQIELESISEALTFKGRSWIRAWQNSVDLQEEFSLKSGPLPLIRRFAWKYPILSTVLNSLEAVIGLGLIGFGGYSFKKRQGYPKLLISGGMLLLADATLKGILGDPLGRYVGMMDQSEKS